MSDYDTNKKLDEIKRLLQDMKSILDDISIYLAHIDDNTSQ